MSDSVKNTSPGSVLVVDDERANCIILSEHLKREGHMTTVVMSGHEALDTLKHSEFDLVMLDVMMPGIDGYEVLRRIREQYMPNELPVIMVTALTESEDMVLALELGANDYLTKPVDIPVMRARAQTQISLCQSARAQRESEVRYRDLFLHAGVLIQSVDPDGSFEYVNNTWHNVLGYTEEDLETLSLFDIVHPDSREHCQALFDQIMDGKDIDHLEAIFVSKDGQPVVVEGNTNGIYKDGFVVGTRSIFRDVTDKRKAEQALEEKNRILLAFQEIGWIALTSLDLDKVLDTLVEQIVHAGVFRSLTVALVDHDTEVVRVVRGIYKDPSGNVWNKNEEVMGLTYALDDKNITAEIARTGELTVIEGWDDRYDKRSEENKYLYENVVSYFLPVKQGDQVLAVLGTGSTVAEKEKTLHRIDLVTPLLDQIAMALNQVRLYQGTHRQAHELAKVNEQLKNEVSEREEAEAEVREREERFRGLFEQSNDGILMHNVEGQVLDANHSACDMLRYDRDDLCALALADLRVADMTLVGRQSVDIEHLQGSARYETRFQRADDQIIDVEISASIIDEDEGIVQSIVRDITQRKLNDQSLRESQTRLKLLHSISSTRIAGASINDVIHSAVQQMASFFSDYRISYVTCDCDGYLKALCSQGPDHMPSLADLDTNIQHAEDYINLMFRREPMVVDDVTTDDRLAPLVDALLKNKTYAMLDMPVAHATDVVGVLSFDASVPHAWTGHEILTLTGVAEYLSLAIADVRSREKRERAEEALQFRNALLQAQQEATIDGILVVDEHRKWVSYNQQFLKMWGIPSEVEKTKDSDLALRVVMKNLVDPQEFLDRVAYLYEHHEEKSRDEISLTDGRIFDRYSTPMFGTEGQYYGRVWYFRDVTDYKRIEEALRQSNDELEVRVAERTAALQESEERFLQLAENIREGFYVVSVPERQSLYLSPSCEQVFGISLNTQYENAKAFESAVFEEDREKLEAALKQEREGIATQTEFRIVGEDGSIRWIWDQAFPIKDANGNVYRVVGIAEDITEQKALSEQLLQAQKMEAVGRLAGGVAHDFNNLLTVINGYSKLALRQLDKDAPLRGNMEEIRTAGERARGLTSQLLAFSRKQMLQPKILEINEVVADLQKMLRRLIGEDIELTATLGANSQVMADPVQLEQVVMNLAVNARDAMPTGGSLTVETRDVVLDIQTAQQPQLAPGPYVRLSVVDTGMGIDSETCERIFEPFFTTKAQGKGTGLGLSTVYGIITQSGGGIAVDSVLGEGTAFHIYLPPHLSELTEEESEDVPEMVKGQGTILVVEDEDMVRLLAVAVLEELGYHVIHASSGEEACEIFEENMDQIEMLITDVIMPQMSGKDLADRLCALRPELKVLYVSGYTDDIIGHHGVLDPDVAFLQKPFMPEELSVKVQEQLAT